MKKFSYVLLLIFAIDANVFAGEQPRELKFYSGVCGKIVKIRDRFQARNEIKVVFDKLEVASVVDGQVFKGPLQADTKYMVSSSTYPLLEGERKLQVEMYYHNQIYNTLLMARQSYTPHACVAYVFNLAKNKSGIDHVAAIGATLDAAIDALKERVQDF